jgi:hypothetical protein
MPKSLARSAVVPGLTPFTAGSVAVVSLGSPREKFWGMILALAPEGLSISGIDLASMEDLAAMVKQGEPASPAVLFFPMHRIERIELDLPDGNLPSLSQRFTATTGMQPAALLRAPLANLTNGSKAHRAAPHPREGRA